MFALSPLQTYTAAEGKAFCSFWTDTTPKAAGRRKKTRWQEKKTYPHSHANPRPEKIARAWSDRKIPTGLKTKHGNTETRACTKYAVNDLGLRPAVKRPIAVDGSAVLFF